MSNEDAKALYEYLRTSDNGVTGRTRTQSANVDEMFASFDEMTRSEAHREALLEQRERDNQAWKARIIGSATEMDLVIDKLEKPERLKIMKLVADLTDAGLELANPHQHYDLPRQTKDMVVELAQLVENAIEEYINE